MKRSLNPKTWQARGAAFGILPLVLGLLSAQSLRWADVIWLSDAGGTWPFILSAISIAILIKLVFSPFQDGSSSVAAFLTLWLTWYYVPMWVWAVETPYTSAVVSKDGRIHVAREATRYPGSKVWLLTGRPGVKLIRGVAGRLVASHLDVDYRFAGPYIASRPDGDDVSLLLASAAGRVLGAEARGTRASRIALLQSRDVQQSVLGRICSMATGGAVPCPLHLSLAAQKEETAPGALWSLQYTEAEAIEEHHLPTVVQLLTQPESPVVHRDKVFALLLELAGSTAPLASVAQRSHLLDDAQFDEIVRRILSFQGCGDGVVAALIGTNRLSAQQRRDLRTKVLNEASATALVENADALHVSDAEIAAFASRLRPAFLANPALSVQALKVFGSRMPAEAQRAAIEGIVNGKASHALAALEHVNFSEDHRLVLMQKVLADATLDDFSDARISKDRLQTTLTPPELRALIAMSVKRSERSDKWLGFTLAMLPVRAMTLPERRLLLNGLLFESPKSALEFVSKNRDFLEPAEVGEVTRDYTRTVTRDFCLHLSHRNKNWRTNFFSEDQLRIFRDCAEAR